MNMEEQLELLTPHIFNHLIVHFQTSRKAAIFLKGKCKYSTGPGSGKTTSINCQMCSST